jgi:hypothetical protein
MEGRAFDWQVALGSFQRLHWGWIAASFLPIFGTYYGRALRWAVFLRPLRPHPSMGGLLSATIVGFTAITLFGRPGEFVRPFLIARKENVPLTSQLAAWALERLFDLLMALIVLRLRPHPGAQLGYAGGRQTVVGMPRRRKGGGWPGVGAGTCFSLRHFAEPVRDACCRLSITCPKSDIRASSVWSMRWWKGSAPHAAMRAMLAVFLFVSNGF